MVIDQNKCIGCGMCIPYCPVKAISIQNRKAYIDLDRCVECGNCLFSKTCPRSALVQQTLVMSRAVRAIFSNVREKSPNTGVLGRGTEEMKTNDVTDRYPLDKIGFACEMGRPSTGTSFEDVETIARVVVAHGGELEACNPTALIFREDQPGIVKDEFRGERALSVIIEALIDPEELPGLLRDLKEAQKQVKTVFSVDCISRLENGQSKLDELLAEAGVARRPNGKTCVGLGRALV